MPPQVRTKVSAAALTMPHAGGGAGDNEDSVHYVIGGEPNDWADLVAVVADGVGSSQAPRAASQAAVETWSQFLESRFASQAPYSTFDEPEFVQLVREGLVQAHRQVLSKAPGGSATAAGVCIQGPWLLVGTVGDARVYCASEGVLKPVTADRVDAAGNPTDVLGGRSAAPVVAAYAGRSLRPGDWIVVCSDGLAKTASNEEVAGLLGRNATPERAIEELRDWVLQRAVEDDVTVVLARVESIGVPFWSADRAGPTPSENPPESVEPTQGKKGVGVRVRSEPDVSDLDQRLTRLERSGSAGGLSQQESQRIQSEFSRLEREIDSLRAGSPSSRGPAWLLTVGALAIGLAVGWLIPHQLPANRADVPTREPITAFKPQAPADLSVALQDLPTETGLVLRYRSKDGHRKVAIYRYAGGGKPVAVFAVPDGTDAGTGTAGDRSAPAH